MPSNILKVGPFAAVYVGNYGDSAVLTQALSISTGPMMLNDEVPEQYEPILDNTIQNGLRKITFTISFYSDDQLTINLARGLTVSETNKGKGSPFNQYVVLLVHPDDTDTSSILITKCYTVKDMKINYEKTAATKVDIQFVATS